MKYLFLYVPDLIWFNRRYCILVKQIHQGEVSYSPKRSFTFTKKSQIISIWYCSDQLPTSVSERVIYLFIKYWFTSLFIYLFIYLFIVFNVYSSWSAETRKKQFQKKRKNTGENPGVGVCFWSNFYSPAKHTACILI